MPADLLKMLVFIGASTGALMIAILIAARIGRRQDVDLRLVIAIALAISAVGIPLGKYGQNFGLPWQVYYSVPALATLLIPPILFRFSVVRSLAYAAMAFISAPLIHVVFF